MKAKHSGPLHGFWMVPAYRYCLVFVLWLPLMIDCSVELWTEAKLSLSKFVWVAVIYINSVNPNYENYLLLFETRIIPKKFLFGLVLFCFYVMLLGVPVIAAWVLYPQPYRHGMLACSDTSTLHAAYTAAITLKQLQAPAFVPNYIYWEMIFFPVLSLIVV